MRVGSLVYATDQGLGVLAKAFYDHGVVTDVQVIIHTSRPTHYEWYGRKEADCIPARRIGVGLYQQTVHQFCKSVDMMLFFETPFDWSLIDYCRQHGVKTVIMPMFECMPETPPDEPDLWLCPSLLDLRYYPQGIYLPVPVEQPWRKRERARVFVHNAGHGGLKGRNGTEELKKAWRKVAQPAHLIIRTQDLGNDSMERNEAGGMLEIRHGTFSYGQLYREGDVFVFPEKFNGLSLPLQEAYASGMMVMATNRFPNNVWLPTEPLIPTVGSRKDRISGRCHEYDESVLDPKEIAACIDAWYDRDISQFSDRGRQWANVHSWQVLGPKYQHLLTDLAVKGTFRDFTTLEF